MRALSLFVLSIAVLGASGCKRMLTRATARNAIQERIGPQLKNAVLGEVTVMLGDAPGNSPADGCAEESAIPYEVLEAGKFATPGIVTIDRPQPCLWTVKLKDSLRADLEDFQRTESDGQVSLKLGRYKDFEITKLSRSGSSASAAILLNFPFTETMTRLATTLYYPDLDEKGCRYDLPSKRFQCSVSMPLTLLDGRWQVAGPSPDPQAN